NFSIRPMSCFDLVVSCARGGLPESRSTTSASPAMASIFIASLPNIVSLHEKNWRVAPFAGFQLACLRGRASDSYQTKRTRLPLRRLTASVLAQAGTQTGHFPLFGQSVFDNELLCRNVLDRKSTRLNSSHVSI